MLFSQTEDTSGKRGVHSGYKAWYTMLQRCHSEICKDRHPTYTNVSMCEEWLSSSKFVDWWKVQRKEDGWQLDKDLLVVGNKVYSPDTCICVPRWLNNFTTDSAANRGKYMIGVTWRNDRKKYQSSCRNPLLDKQEHVGYFLTELEAYEARKARKLELALELKLKMDDIDLRIYPNVVTIVKNAK